MKRFAAALLGILAFASCVLHAEDGAKPLRVVFWNVEWFPGGFKQSTIQDAIRQLNLVAPAVGKLQPDIISFEEMMDEEAMKAALLQTPGVTPLVCSEFKDEEGQPTIQQIGIASRLPAMSAWAEAWKAGRITPKRGFSFAAFEPSPGHVLLVYALHLKSNRGNEREDIAMREESMKQLIDHIAAMEKAYAHVGAVTVVVGGDFNTSTDDAKFALERTIPMLRKEGFDWCWQDVPFKDRVTIPTKPSNNPAYPPFPDACFDHVFVKGGRFVSARVENVPGDPSDHRPVIVELETGGKPTP